MRWKAWVRIENWVVAVPCLSQWERWLADRRDGEGLGAAVRTVGDAGPYNAFLEVRGEIGLRAVGDAGSYNGFSGVRWKIEGLFACFFGGVWYHNNS